jgi:GMP synthase-like glutamine amidotransferase
LRLLILQNSDFEKAGALLEWAKERGFLYETIRAYEQALPAPEAFTHLVLLGSPLSVTEIERVPWLKAEAELAKAFMDEGKRVLGICLGSQILAHLLGGEVSVGPHAEIGWHEVRGTGSLPPATLFQWHREIFSLPPGATPFGRSAATSLQGFWMGERILALAGHPEIDEDLVRGYIDRCWSDEWLEAEKASGLAAFIQRPEEMLREAKTKLTESREAVFEWLDKWAGR